jgi:hypothetical protein
LDIDDPDWWPIYSVACWPVFAWIELNAVQLIVPKGTKALYQAANVWKDFKTIEESDFSGLNTVQSPLFSAYVSNNILSVNSIVAETVTVYSLLGSRLLSVEKPAGAFNFSVEKIQDRVLIVKGSSGWVQKLIK